MCKEGSEVKGKIEVGAEGFLSTNLRENSWINDPLSVSTYELAAVSFSLALRETG